MLDEKRINPYRLFQGAFIPNWLLRRSEVSAGAKLTYARLTQYAGKNGEAYPFVKTLAQELGVEWRQVHRYLSELTACGLVEVESHKEEGKASHYWFLNHPWIWDSSVQDDEADDGGKKGDHLPESAGPTCQSEHTPLPREADPPCQIGQFSKRIIEVNHEAGQIEGAALASLTADALAEPGSPPTPLPPTAVESSADDVGSGGENSDTGEGNVHVDAPRLVWSRKAVREKELARLRSANLLGQRQSGEQSMREKRTTEEKVKNLRGRDGKLNRKVMAGLEKRWVKGFTTLFPGLKIIPWGPAEKKQIEKLVLGHDLKGDKGYGEEVVDASIKYVLLEWPGLKTRFLKGNGLAPSISFLFYHHATLCVEAQRWVSLFQVEREYEMWREQHPQEFHSPSDLMQRYLTAKDELDELRGLKKAAAK